MSKKAIVCTVLALSLILVGTAYAFWTDSLNVTTRATTGDFDVTFADLGLYAQYGNEYNGGNWSIIDGIGADGYVPASYFQRNESYNQIAALGQIDGYYAGAMNYNSVQFDAELVDAQPIVKDVGPYLSTNTNGSDNILITVDGMYPGYAQAFRTDILNQGSIAAKLSSIQFGVGGIGDFAINDATKDMLGIAVLVEKEEYNSDPQVEGQRVFALANAMGDAAVFTVGNVDFVRLSALEGLSQDAFSDFNNLLTLPSDNRMDLYIAIAMDPDAEGIYTTGSTAVLADNDDTASQNTGAEITLDLMWDQFNEGFTVDSTNILENQNR